MTILNFIDGDYREPAQGGYLDKKDPATGEPRAKVADSSLLDVVACVHAANKALLKWSKTSAKERSEFLNKMADAIEAKAQDFAQAAKYDIGTPTEQTLASSVPQAAKIFRFYANLAIEIFSNDQALTDIVKTRFPVGIAAIITPASDPLVCLASRLAPALAQGNAVVVKPSRHTPETAEIFSKVVIESGLPNGVYAHLQGRGEEVATTLVQHPAISTIAFLGSTETGRAVAILAAENLKRIHLSLGAKNAALIFSGVDLDRVIPEVASLCLGTQPSRTLQVSRVFIQESIYKDTISRLTKIFNEAEESVLPHERAFEKFRAAAALAKKENGRVTVKEQNEKARGYSVKPVLVSDLTNCSTLQQEEIMGPLALVSSFKYQHEALKHANISPYGRAGYIFETDSEKSKRVAAKFEVGRVFLNCSKPSFVEFDHQDVPLLKLSGSGDESVKSLLGLFSRVLIAR